MGVRPVLPVETDPREVPRRLEWAALRPDYQGSLDFGPLNIPPAEEVVQKTKTTGGGGTSTTHTHDGTGTNSTITGGVAEAGSSVPVASGSQAVAYGDNAQAKDANVVAIGAGDTSSNGAVVDGTGGTAGTDASYSIAIGSGDASNPGPKARRGRSVVIGVGAKNPLFYGGVTMEDVVIGWHAEVRGQQSIRGIAIGSGALNNVAGNAEAGIVIGSSASGTGQSQVVIGDGSSNTGNGGVAIKGNVTGATGVAISGNAKGVCVAILGNANTNRGDVAIGRGTSAAGGGGPAGGGAVAIGGFGPGDVAPSGATASASGATAVGGGGQTSGFGGLAGPQATAVGATALGGTDGVSSGPSATGTTSLAMMAGASASATDAMAVGHGASAAHATAAALGKSAATTKANQVILGTSSEVVTHPGGVEYRINTQTGTSYTATRQDAVVLGNNGAGLTVTLPAAVASGQRLVVKNLNATNLTVHPSGGTDNVDGSTADITLTQYQVLEVVDGASANWYALRKGNV